MGVEISLALEPWIQPLKKKMGLVFVLGRDAGKPESGRIYIDMVDVS